MFRLGGSGRGTHRASDQPISEAVIGAAVEVHRQLGPGPLASNAPPARLCRPLINFNVRVLKDGKDLAPFERRNALKAVAALWQVVNGLDLDPGQLYEIGA